MFELGRTRPLAIAKCVLHLSKHKLTRVQLRAVRGQENETNAKRIQNGVHEVGSVIRVVNTRIVNDEYVSLAQHALAHEVRDEN